jgi:hypothetical protein
MDFSLFGVLQTRSKKKNSMGEGQGKIC